MSREHPPFVPGSVQEPVRGLIDRLADGVVVVGQDGMVRYANPMASQMLAPTGETLAGRVFGYPLVQDESTELDVVVRNRRLTVEMRVVQAAWAGELCSIASLRDITQRAQAETELARLHRELITLHRISQICLSRESLDAAYLDIVEEIARATAFECVLVVRLDDDQSLSVLAGVGLPSEGLLDLGLHETIAGAVIRHRRAVLFPDLAGSTDPASQQLAAHGFTSCIGVPMTVGDGVRGCLLLATTGRHTVGDSFVDWVETLAASVASLTERVRISEELLQSEERFRRLAEHAADMIYRFRFVPEPTFEYVSPSCEVLTGYRPEEYQLEPDLLARMLHPADRHLFDELLHPEAAEASPIRLRWIRKDGAVVWTEQRRTAVYDDRGRQVAIEAIARDVTERTRFEEQLAHQALHDSLTGLPNRTLFLDRLELTLERLRRRPGTAAVLFLDVDNFKVINDGLGHDVGDIVLQEVARRIRDIVRPSDTVARFGGDEFAILLDDVDSGRAAVTAGWRILADLARPVRTPGRQVFVSGSVGLTVLDEGRPTVATVMRHADVAMYRAKEAGRARLVVFDEEMALEAVGALPQRAPVGHGPGGLQRRRRRVVAYFSARPGSLARLPVGRGRARRGLRRRRAAVLRPRAVERERPDPQGAAVRSHQRAEGNHGEDVKEYYFYVDATPRTRMRWRYKYPQAAFPYDDLVRENAARGYEDFEYELVDTGVFDDDRYFDVRSTTPRRTRPTSLVRITVRNRGPPPPIHLLPHLWYRNTGRGRRGPATLEAVAAAESTGDGARRAPGARGLLLLALAGTPSCSSARTRPTPSGCSGRPTRRPT
jgi:diguanylate cyclase (GGDEF)-like protein/PAS domain S-box-containing protein